MRRHAVSSPYDSSSASSSQTGTLFCRKKNCCSSSSFLLHQSVRKEQRHAESRKINLLMKRTVHSEEGEGAGEKAKISCSLLSYRKVGCRLEFEREKERERETDSRRMFTAFSSDALRSSPASLSLHDHHQAPQALSCFPRTEPGKNLPKTAYYSHLQV